MWVISANNVRESPFPDSYRSSPLIMGRESTKSYVFSFRKWARWCAEWDRNPISGIK